MNHEDSAIPPEDFTTEHLVETSDETRTAFDGTLETLRQDNAEHMATRNQRRIEGVIGDFNTDFVHVDTSIERSRKPGAGTDTVRTALAVNVTSATEPSTTDMATLIGMQPPKQRNFSHGETTDDFGMDETIYQQALANIKLSVTDEEWDWTTKAIQIAHLDPDQNRDFLPHAIDELLETSPDSLPVDTDSLAYLNESYFANGIYVQATWHEANDGHLSIEERANHQLRYVTALLPTGEKYVYIKYADETELLHIETDDKDLRASLNAQGLSATTVGGWSEVSQEERFRGIHAPTDTLMQRFTSILDEANSAGIAPAPPYIIP